MSNKGFTLIELLAVIVILAIIALIATPIILGIISDAREEAKERSAEAVIHAMETSYLTSMMLAENEGGVQAVTAEAVVTNTKIDNEAERTETSITTEDGVICTVSDALLITCSGLKNGDKTSALTN